MDGIWDSHIHLFTEEMAANPGEWAKTNGEPVWAACVSPPDRPSIQGWSTPDELMRDMDGAGLEKVVLLGWYWENADSCRLQNRFYADLLRRYPDRLLVFASIQPGDPEVLDEIDRAQDAGFTGLGEIHPQAQGFTLEDSCWLRILEHVTDKGLPINLHVTDPDSPSYPGRVDTPLEPYLAMASVWPNQVFILAHLGGGIPWKFKDRLKDLRKTQLYLDCSAAPLLYDSDILVRCAQSYGADRLLFGTDYPLRVFPKRQRRPEFAQMREWVQSSGLTEAELALVFNENAKRLFSA